MCCSPQTSGHLCLHLLHLLFLSVWQSLLSQHDSFFHGRSLHRVLTQPSWLCLGLSKESRGVLKGDGSICISYRFPSVWVLTPSVARNSFPLNGFCYATHVWGGFLKALSQNSSWLHKKPVSWFAGWFGSPLMDLILSNCERPFHRKLGVQCSFFFLVLCITNVIQWSICLLLTVF